MSFQSGCRVPVAGHWRALAIIGFGLALSGCMAVDPMNYTDSADTRVQVDPALVAMYGPVEDGGFVVPAVDVRRIEPQFFRQVVAVPPGIPGEPGTIVVDPR